MAEPSSSSFPSSSSSTPSERRKTVRIIGPTPERNTPEAKAKAKGKEVLTHDFNFILKNSTIFRHSIAALSNSTFNPSNLALLEVDVTGICITVFTATQSEPGCLMESVFGFLRLQPKFFQLFECFIPTVKMINLEHVLLSLSTGNDAWLLSVFSVHGSNAVTFEFEPDATGRAPDRASVVDLLDARPNYPRFPEIIYGFEGSIPCKLLLPVISDVLKLGPKERPDYVTLHVLPASVSVLIGANEVIPPSEMDELWLNWPFWETLMRATKTSKDCYVYMVAEPAENLMLLFKLSPHDEGITFRKGAYICRNEISCLAFYRSLT